LLVSATLVFVRKIDAPAPPMFYCRDKRSLKSPGQKFKLQVAPKCGSFNKKGYNDEEAKMQI
jgi:hypothetical protein